MSAGRAILALNAGSSSLKFALFEIGASLGLTAKGKIEKLDSAPHFVAYNATGVTLVEARGESSDFASTLEALLNFVDQHLGEVRLCAVGHRVVHGGAAHVAPERVTPALLAALDALVSLDPLHLPHNIAPMRALCSSRPGLAQVACFDTAFHHTMPPEASHFALPRAMTKAGVRRYGFHGLSYEYIVEQLKKSSPALAKGRVVVAHLGAGASLCAIRNGASIATTMSFSPLDGLVMATRCGALDPAVVLYLLRTGKSVAEIENILNRQSGLLGVSEISGDMRALLASKDTRAREAIDLFTYRAAIDISGLAGALGGLDGLVFTAGIGERAPTIRAEICSRLAWLGARLDASANAAHAPSIGASDSQIDVRVIATDEECMIARHTLALTNHRPAARSGEHAPAA
jgi:acetate kinase